MPAVKSSLVHPAYKTEYASGTGVGTSKGYVREEM